MGKYEIDYVSGNIMEIVRFGVIDVRSSNVKRWANYMTRICMEIVRYGKYGHY